MELFSSQSKAQINTLRSSLANTKKQDMKADKFITTMKGFAMELAAAGKKIDDDELKGYILNGLGRDYTPFVASQNAAPNTTLADMCSQLTAYDQRQALLSESDPDITFQSSAHAAPRGRGRSSRPPTPRGGHNGEYRGNYGGNDRPNYGNGYYGSNYTRGGYDNQRGRPF